ncbi:MAG: methionyl-tRNA formyltransferase [Bacteroidota bacterium]
MPKLRLVFMGTPDFAIPSLEILLNYGYDVAAVVTAPDKPQGRGKSIKPSPIKLAAAAHNLPILEPNNLKSLDFLTTLRSYQASLQVVVAFRVLPQVVWSMPILGTLNLHASLLPQYRGAAPINWAIIHGERETGVTTFFIEEAIDTGHILLQAKEPIDKHDTAGTLYERLKHRGAQLVLKTVQAIEQGTYTTHPQPSIPANLLKKAPKIYRQDCQINWRQGATSIRNFIRGLSPRPGAWTILDGKETKILKTSQVAVTDLGPGVLRSDGQHYLYVGTQREAIAIEQLQPAGKKLMDIQAFLRGYQIKLNTKLQ